MRTRRSWRNQNRLFKALFKPADQPVAVEPILTDSAIDAMYWIPKTSRNLMKKDAAKRRKATEVNDYLNFMARGKGSSD